MQFFTKKKVSEITQRNKPAAHHVFGLLQTNAYFNIYIYIKCNIGFIIFEEVATFIKLTYSDIRLNFSKCQNVNKNAQNIIYKSAKRKGGRLNGILAHIRCFHSVVNICIC